MLSSKVTQIHIHTHSSYSFPLWLITGYGVQVPVPYSRIVLLITAVISDENGFLLMNQFSFKKCQQANLALPCRGILDM